ncbi:MAG: hypothetical protein QOF28_1066, partial [Actinomycetota bacterium]|nr:hypothetical protein [Actinomycetota bacterium]
EWWNGRHDGLKIRCSKGRVGSTPTSGTLTPGVHTWRHTTVSDATIPCVKWLRVVPPVPFVSILQNMM